MAIEDSEEGVAVREGGLVDGCVLHGLSPSWNRVVHTLHFCDTEVESVAVASLEVFVSDWF